MLTINLKKQLDLALLCLMLLAFYVGNAAVEIIGAICILRSFFIRHTAAFTWHGTAFRVSVIIISIIMVSSIFNAPTSSILSSLALLRVPFLAVALTILMCNLNDDELSILFHFLAFLLLVMCLNSLWQAHTGIDIFGAKAQKIEGEISRLTTPTGKLRIGYIIAFMTVLLYGFLLSRYKSMTIGKNLFFATVCALSVAVVFMSGERVAAYLLFAVIPIASLLKLPKKHFLFLFLGLAIGIGAILYMKPSVFYRHINTNSMELGNITAQSSHFKVFANAFYITSLRDVLGHGARTFRNDCMSTDGVPYPQYCTTHAHNLYLEVLFEGGIVAFLFLLMVVFSFIFTFIRDYNSNIDGMVLITGLTILFKLVPIIPMPSIHAAWAFAPICLVIAGFVAFDRENNAK